jgi:predicted porin
MKKTLIALAVLAASGAAFAQSSVTLSGAFRVGVLNNDAGTSVSPNQGSGNVLNVGVTEDLGGGLKAMASSQLRFDAANGAFRNESGAGGDKAGFHLATIGLAGGFGTVELGRIGFDQFWGYNPNGSNGAHVNPLTFAGATQNGQWRYTAPAFVTGLKVQVGGALKANNTGAEANSSQVLVTYANGPLAATFVQEKVYGNQVGAGSLVAGGAKITGIGASYDLGVAKLMLVTGNQKSATTGAEQAKGTAISAAIPMGALTGKIGFLNDQMAANADKTSIGVDYALSKRTVVSADFFKTKSSATGQNIWVGARHSF